MNGLLEASSDPLWVFLVFTVCLVAFHYLLIKRYPLSLKQWKLVEYIWVGLALLSIVGIVEEARFYRANMTIGVSREETEDKVAALDQWLDLYREYACEDQVDEPSFQPLCRWLKVKRSDLRLILANEVFPYDVPDNFLVGIDQDLVRLNRNEKATVSALHQEYLEARAQYLTAVSEGRRGRFSALLVALAPLLFAVAIAIKFTKVTGEYLLTKS